MVDLGRRPRYMGVVPQSLDELHQRMQTEVIELTGGRSFAAPTVAVFEVARQPDGRIVTGGFHAFQSDQITALRRAGLLRRRLLLLRAAFFERYHAGHISLVAPYADALALIWKGQPPYQISQTFMKALASLAHEEFHAISQEWWWLVHDRLLSTPAVNQFGEGLAELAVQELLPEILTLMKLAPLRKSLHFLDSRTYYLRQREAARCTVRRHR